MTWKSEQLLRLQAEHLTRIMSTGNSLSQKTALEATLGVRAAKSVFAQLWSSV